MKSVTFTALSGLPEIAAGADLTEVIATAVSSAGLVPAPLGVAGLPSILDRRGEYDREGRALEMTEVAWADAIAAGAALVMGEASEGTPVVIARGLEWSAAERDGAALLRPTEQDLFR